MTVSTPTASPVSGLGPHALAQRVPCTICGVSTGSACIDADGASRPDPHHSRWIRYQHLMRNRPFTAVVRRRIDDDLEPGDVVLCVTSEDGMGLDVLADGLGRLDATGRINSRDVQFQAFIEDTGFGARRSGPMVRRPGRHTL